MFGRMTFQALGGDKWCEHDETKNLTCQDDATSMIPAPKCEELEKISPNAIIPITRHIEKAVDDMMRKKQNARITQIHLAGDELLISTFNGDQFNIQDRFHGSNLESPLSR